MVIAADGGESGNQVSTGQTHVACSEKLGSDVRNGRADRGKDPTAAGTNPFASARLGVGLQNLMDFHSSVKGFLVLS